MLKLLWYRNILRRDSVNIITNRLIVDEGMNCENKIIQCGGHVIHDCFTDYSNHDHSGTRWR